MQQKDEVYKYLLQEQQQSMSSKDGLGEEPIEYKDKEKEYETSSTDDNSVHSQLLNSTLRELMFKTQLLRGMLSRRATCLGPHTSGFGLEAFGLEDY